MQKSMLKISWWFLCYEN